MDRNLTDYHAEAIAARYLYGREYSRQRGGQMDFYEQLTESQKAVCRRLVSEIKQCERREAPP